jgi:hypothetical protein
VEEEPYQVSDEWLTGDEPRAIWNHNANFHTSARDRMPYEREPVLGAKEHEPKVSWRGNSSLSKQFTLSTIKKICWHPDLLMLIQFHPTDLCFLP